MIKRDEFLLQLKEEKRFRKSIRRLLKTFFKEKEEKKIAENRLRSVIKNLIKEAAKTDVPTAQPHKNTGINVLEDLLKNIIPVIEDDYKALTSAKEQRISFRAHILNGVQNSLEPVDVVTDVPKGAEIEELAEVEEDPDLTIAVTDDDKFIPVRDSDQEPEEEEEESFSSIEGMDETGRNFASNTFNKIEKQILEAYESLANNEDRELFYDYLLTNLKLYFDKFEDELKLTVPEPESPDYEPTAPGAEEVTL